MKKYIEIKDWINKGNCIIISCDEEKQVEFLSDSDTLLINATIEKIISPRGSFSTVIELDKYILAVCEGSYPTDKLFKSKEFTELYLCKDVFINKASRLSFDNENDAKLYLEII